MHVNSVLLAELEAHPGAAHTKTDAVAHSGDVSHKILTSEIPMPLGVEVPGICQQVHEGMMLGNNSKAVPLLFQAPGMQASLCRPSQALPTSSSNAKPPQSHGHRDHV